MSKPGSFIDRARDNRADSITRRPSATFLPPAANSGRNAGLATLAGASLIPVARIAPDPDQPRKTFDEQALRDLADSLATLGQMQTINVRWSEDVGLYIIVSGERRWRAAQLAGLPTMKCVVQQAESTADDLLERQLVENCLREGLNPVEQAVAYKTLMDGRGISAHQLAERLKVDRSSVTKALSLLNLPPDVQSLVDAGALAASSAHAIAVGVEGAAAQAELAAQVVEEGMSRAEVVEAVRRSAPKPRKPSAGKVRGAGPAKLPTSRTIRLPGNIKITVEARKGIGPGDVLAALLGAVALVRSESSEAA